MKRPMYIVFAIGALLSAQPASAAQGSDPSGQNSQVVRQLESRKAQLDEKLARSGFPQGRGDSGPAIRRQRIREQRQQIQDLLEKARAGQEIDPAEIPR